MKISKKEKKNLGICTQCGEENDRKGMWYCTKCSEYYNAMRRMRKIEDIKNGICVRCHIAKANAFYKKGGKSPYCVDCKTKYLDNRS